MNILITGSEGFIGSHLTEKLVKLGHKVKCTVLYNSFNNYGWLENIDKKILLDMKYMFSYASKFNQPIGDWDTKEVRNMRRMFKGASEFNQPIGNWDTGSVESMEWMFRSASAFNQPIGDWDVSSIKLYDADTGFKLMFIERAWVFQSATFQYLGFWLGVARLYRHRCFLLGVDLPASAERDFCWDLAGNQYKLTLIG